MSVAMIAMTTKSSTRVKPCRGDLEGPGSQHPVASAHRCCNVPDSMCFFALDIHGFDHANPQFTDILSGGAAVFKRESTHRHHRAEPSQADAMTISVRVGKAISGCRTS